MRSIEVERPEAQAAMAAAVEEVLETMCFTGVLSSSETAGPEANNPRPAMARLRFEGRRSGEFCLSVPMKLARVLGSGFLGREEDEISDTQATEVVCEIANMFCGSVLSRLEGETIFHLSHPEAVLNDAGAGGKSTGIHRRFELEGGTLTACLEFEQAL